MAVVTLGITPVVARTDDAVLDDGPVVSIAAGENRLVWARTGPAGTVLLTRRPAGGVRTLPVAPMQEVRTLDVGADRSGRATATYIACRTVCGTFSLRLDGGAEQAQPIPRPPSGCVYDAAVLDGALYLGLTSCRRQGIYRLRGGRLEPVHRGRVLAFDIAGGRLAYAQETPDGLGVQVIARRLGERRGRVMIVDEGPSVGNTVIHTPQWVGARLWIGIYYENEGGPGIAVQRCTYPARRCEDAVRREAKFPFVTGWGFASGHIYSTTRESMGPEDSRTSRLRQWTDPAPRWRRASCCG